MLGADFFMLFALCKAKYSVENVALILHYGNRLSKIRLFMEIELSLQHFRASQMPEEHI